MRVSLRGLLRAFRSLCKIGIVPKPMSIFPWTAEMTCGSFDYVCLIRGAGRPLGLNSLVFDCVIIDAACRLVIGLLTHCGIVQILNSFQG